ncbi:MAG: ATP-binding protein [Pseudazoarcus pumilus]|nr:ATP-binding protein [Pseudazoarcus pumilus]
MDLEISDTLRNRLLGCIDPDSPLGQRLNECAVYHGRSVVPSKLFDEPALNAFHDLCETVGERTTMLQIAALRRIRNEPAGIKVDKLELFIPALVAYLFKDIEDGWLYRRNKDGVLLPWLVSYVRQYQPENGWGSPYVIVGLKANTIWSAHNEATSDSTQRDGGMTNAIVFHKHDLVGKTIPELLAERGYFKETAELKQEYEAHEQRFLALQSRFGMQFSCRNALFLANGPQDTEFMKMPRGMVAKCVNDEGVLERNFDFNADTTFWRELGIPFGFERVPLHCYLYLFHLELHRNVWVHVQNLEPYEYKPELREKLVLPDSHRDLIDILTSDMEVLQDDIVEGKSGGTIILCQGAPGLGKTLTAEVYSEVVGKPLYRVHSGQLGITAESVEANLSTVLQRAARWDAIMLLDEADVYIRCRDNDLQHNAIVAEFLRTLEYFSGLLFMTTNRIDDVDDAILSRCIATIRYDVPPREAAARLWQTLAAQFDVELPPALIDTLVDTYAQASGRDIKELLKLTARFCKSKGQPLSAEAFAQCAVFRGLGGN